MPWIEHPATQDGPVSVIRWTKYHIANWMRRTADRWEDDALHPDRKICPDCGRRMYSHYCDHIPF